MIGLLSTIINECTTVGWLLSECIKLFASCARLLNLIITFQPVCRTQGPVLCRPTNNVRHILLRRKDIILGSAQDRPLQSVSNVRYEKNAYQWFRFCPGDGRSHPWKVLKNKIQWKIVIARLKLPMELWCRSDGTAFASKLAVCPSLQHHPYRGRSLPMTKIATA